MIEQGVGYVSFPEVMLPDLIANQLDKPKIGSVLKISGTFSVKEKSENGINIEITSPYLENKRKRIL